MKIKIVGDSSLHEFEDVKDIVIQLGGKYYYKHDNVNLIKVELTGGKKRLFRKESQLICDTVQGIKARKIDCIKTPEGLYILKNHPTTITLDDGTVTHESWCVRINNKWYLKTDPKVVKLANGRYILRELAVRLSDKHYPKETYVDNDENVVELPIGWVLTNDVIKTIYWDTETNSRKSTLLVKKGGIDLSLVTNVFNGFKDSTNPQIGRYNFAAAEKSNVVKYRDFYILKEEAEEFDRQYNEIKAAAVIKKTTEVRKKLNSSFSDYDTTENTAPAITEEYETWPGKHKLFGSNETPIHSLGIGLTGGLGYSFGVEIETSAGLVPREDYKRSGLPFIAVGDRSIGAAEYVTPPLHGDNGMEVLDRICDLVASHTFVDDRCSIHVHVGPATYGFDPANINMWDLKFDRRFAIAMIKMSTDLEEELYQMLPKSRNPYNRHCHSIMRYAGINENNWREYLGTFVFGPQEDFNTTVDMRNYVFGQGSYTKQHRLSTWCGGRYKWLNLVRAYSECSSPTCEIRIWSASTNKVKIKNYVLLSLAMVHMANTQYKYIMNNKVNLRDVVLMSFPDFPAIQVQLLDFIEKRKLSFNRKVIYDKIPLDQIRSITSESIKQPLTI